MASHFIRQNQKIIADYIRAGGAWPAKRVEIAEWALRNDRWQPSRSDIVRMCGEALVEAMREEVFQDETGRTVRAKLPARTTRDGEQGTFWDDIRTSEFRHVRIGVAQRRNGIAAECFNLFKIVRYSNAHRSESEQIELVLNFSNDVAELDQPPRARRRRESEVSVALSSEQSSQRDRARFLVRRSTSRQVSSSSGLRIVREPPPHDSSSGPARQS